MDNSADSTDDDIFEEEILSSSSQELLPIEEDEDNVPFQYEYPRPRLCRDPFLFTGMMQDVLLNNKEELLRKISSGVSAEMVDNNKKSLLHFAVQVARDDTSMIDLLLQQEKIDINAIDKRKLTPLMDSILQDKSFVAIHLIKGGANVNFPAGCTPLHLCAKLGLSEVGEALIQAGADLNALNYSNDTPLQLAVEHDRFEMMCLLLCYGAEIGPDGTTNLRPFTFSILRKKFEFADVLLEYETEFDSVSLECAIKNEYPNLEYLLIKIVEEDDNFCFTPGLECLYILSKNVDACDFVWGNIHVECTYIDSFCFENTDREYPQDRDINQIVYLLKASRLELIMKFVEYSADNYFLSRCFRSFDINSKVDYYEVCALFLSYGLVVWETEMEAVFECFGYCDLFRLLLHMDIKFEKIITGPSVWYLYYLVDYRMSFRDVVDKVLGHNEYYLFPYDYKRLRRLTVLPPLKKLDQIDWFPVVAKLTELARNVLRFQLCVKNKIKNSSQFHSMLNILPFPNYVKKIISLETPLYAIESNDCISNNSDVESLDSQFEDKEYDIDLY